MMIKTMPVVNLVKESCTTVFQYWNEAQRLKPINSLKRQHVVDKTTHFWVEKQNGCQKHQVYSGK